MKKPTKITNKLIIILIAAVITGCGEESRRTDYVARVNDSFLTEDEIERIIHSTPGNNFYRNEIIRNWVNREILFLKAEDKGIVRTEQYRRIIGDSEKELAAAMLLEQVFNDEDISVSDDEIEEYYNISKEEFRLTEDHYLLNTARFISEERAIEFRNRVVESRWDAAVSDFSDKKIIQENRNSVFVSAQDVHPVAVLRVVRELYPGEISIVIAEASDLFSVIQMLQKYDSGTIPPMAVIKESLSRRFINKAKQDLLKNYLKELYSGYEIEIRQE